MLPKKIRECWNSIESFLLSSGGNLYYILTIAFAVSIVFTGNLDRRLSLASVALASLGIALMLRTLQSQNEAEKTDIEPRDTESYRRWTILNRFLIVLGIFILVSAGYCLLWLRLPTPAGALFQASALFLGAGGVSTSIEKYRHRTVEKEEHRAKIDRLNHLIYSEKLMLDYYREQGKEDFERFAEESKERVEKYFEQIKEAAE